MLKMLFYCAKAQPFLYHDIDYCYDTGNIIDLGYKTCKYTNFRIYDPETGQFLGWDNQKKACENESMNGKIVAVSDFEVEKITKVRNYYDMKPEAFDNLYYTKTLDCEQLSISSCMTTEQFDNYLKDKNGYAIHIENLNVFDRAKELCNYEDEFESPLEKAPQNMIRCYSTLYSNVEADMPIRTDCYILIYVTPQEACNILNHKQDILIRKNVLKEMKHEYYILRA